MNGNLPSGEDFNFMSGGYPCAIGVDTLTLDSGGDEYGIRLVKMKAKAAAPSGRIADWETVHYFSLVDRDAFPVNSVMQQFLVDANPKLILATGGEVPPVPDTFLEQIKHLCRYGLAFNASTGEVYIK